MWVANHLLVQFSAHFIGGNTSLVLLIWPRIHVEELISPRGRPTTILLNEHSTSFLSNNELVQFLDFMEKFSYADGS